jgi:predicted nucleotidyltransferase
MRSALHHRYKNMMQTSDDPYELVIRKRQEILALAQRRGAKNIRIFGSVSRHEARPDSDIDLLIDLEPGRSLLEAGSPQRYSLCTACCSGTAPSPGSTCLCA